jgi:hypothetical protein
MNRMTPLITRAATLRPLAPPPARLLIDAAWESREDWREDVQFFVTAWLGAFLFLGTLFG